MIDYDAVLDSVEVTEEMPEAVTVIGEMPEAVIDYYYNIDKMGIPKEDIFDVALAKSKLDAENMTQLIEISENLIVDTDVTAKKAVSMALQAKKIVNQMEKTRKKIIRPMLDFNKAVSDYSKDLTKCLKDMEESLLFKIEAYQGKRKESLDSQNIIDNSMEKIVVEDGTVIEHKAWVFDIEDINSIPLEYMEVAERAIKEAIRKGIRTIPGLKIYEKTSIRSRVK